MLSIKAVSKYFLQRLGPSGIPFLCHIFQSFFFITIKLYFLIVYLLFLSSRVAKSFHYRVQNGQYGVKCKSVKAGYFNDITVVVFLLINFFRKRLLRQELAQIV